MYGLELNGHNLVCEQLTLLYHYRFSFFVVYWRVTKAVLLFRLRPLQEKCRCAAYLRQSPSTRPLSFFLNVIVVQQLNIIEDR